MTLLPSAVGRIEAVPVSAWLAVAGVLVAERVVARLGMWPYALFALPGTLAHEAAHWLVAKLLFARPRFPDLRPARTARGWRLGSVAFAGPWWRAAPIALAPLALFPLALWWTVALLAPASAGAFAVHAWIAGTLLNAALPSRADWRIAAPSLLVLGALVLAAWAFARVAAG